LASPPSMWRTLHPRFRVDGERLDGAIAQRGMILDQAPPDHASVDLCALLDTRFLSSATPTTDPPGKPVKRKSVHLRRPPMRKSSANSCCIHLHSGARARFGIGGSAHRPLGAREGDAGAGLEPLADLLHLGEEGRAAPGGRGQGPAPPPA